MAEDKQREQIQEYSHPYQPYGDSQYYEYSQPYDDSIPYDYYSNTIDYSQTFDESAIEYEHTTDFIAPLNIPYHDALEEAEQQRPQKKIKPLEIFQSSAALITSEPISYTHHAQPVPSSSSTQVQVAYDMMGAVPYPVGYTSSVDTTAFEIAAHQPTQLDASSDTYLERQRKIQQSHLQAEHKVKESDAGVKKRIIRSGGGQIWEDTTLNDWDPKDYRIFVGDLGRDVSDDALNKAFSKYPSMQKAKIVRDRKTLRTKGYGFVSFKDPHDYVKAMKEMNGKFVGSRPIKLSKSTWDDRNLSVKELKQATGSTKIPKKKDQVSIVMNTQI
jgi:hypothetical protein